MATTIPMHHPQTGIQKTGIYGFSWTTFFFGGLPAFFRGDIVVGVCVIIAGVFTCWIAPFIWAFMYNKRYTLALVEKGYVFVGSEAENARAKQKLGIV
jgi:hypothetical protein